MKLPCISICAITEVLPPTQSPPMALLPKSCWRKLHPWVVPIAAAPLLLRAANGSSYSQLLEQGIDAFWLIRITLGALARYSCSPTTSLSWARSPWW
jgi:hypothetical protein